MINDIEKMQSEFNEKIAIAKKENELNEGIMGDFQLKILSKDTVHVWKPYKTGVGFDNPTIKDVKEVLNKFPPTKDILYDKKLILPYIITSSRRYSDKCGELSINWCWENYKFYASVNIDDFVADFFNVSSRETDDCENSTYASIQRFDERGRRCVYRVPVYDFKKEQFSYYGGVRVLTDKQEIYRIIEFINKEV